MKWLETGKLARSLGVTKKTLEAYENGAREPRDMVKIQLAGELGETVTSLFYCKAPADKRRTTIADNVRRLILEKGELDIEEVMGLCHALKCTPNTLYGME